MYIGRNPLSPRRTVEVYANSEDVEGSAKVKLTDEGPIDMFPPPERVKALRKDRRHSALEQATPVHL